MKDVRNVIELKKENFQLQPHKIGFVNQLCLPRCGSHQDLG